MGNSFAHSLLACVAPDEQVTALLRHDGNDIAPRRRGPHSACHKDDATVLHAVAAAGDLATLSALVEVLRRSQPREQEAHFVRALDQKDLHGSTPLMVSCAHGHDHVAGFLVAAGADPYAGDVGGLTALHHAVRGGHTACVEAIMNNLPADKVVQKRVRLVWPAQGRSNFSWLGGPDAGGPVQCLQTVRLQDVQDKSGLSPLHFAVGFNQAECVKALLGHDVLLTSRSKIFTTELGFPLPPGCTPLHCAAYCGLVAIAEELLKYQTSRLASDQHHHHTRRHGAVDARLIHNKGGATPLQMAAHRQQPARLLQLLHPSTNLATVFDIAELAAPASGVAKLTFIAAAALRSKLLADLQAVAVAAVAAKAPAAARPPAPMSASQNSPRSLDRDGAAYPDAEAGVVLPGTAVDAPSPSGSSSASEQRRPAAAEPERTSSLDLCAVCFERVPDVEVGGCDHRLCSTCAERMCRRFTDRPLSCPFCRGSINKFKARSLA